MWAKKGKSTFSNFFEGKSIFETIKNSTFGKFRDIITKFFSDSAQQYNLPKVIVIGNESTGKSSLLENITKCQIFPRNSSLCTKCPVHLKLITGDPEYSISYFDHTTKTQKILNIENRDDIYKEVLKIFNSYPADVIYEQEIEITIKDLNMPNFEFFDLPGIRSYPPELAEKTTAICRKYLEDKNSIVICVVPATTPRLTSCQSIALIIETNMQHNCILALTMADRLHPENFEDLLIKRILKTSDEVLGLNFAGYTAIVNRSHTDNKSLIENDDYEIEWFNENIMSGIPAEYSKHIHDIENCITISRLLKNMDNLYNKFMNAEWKPRVLKDINDEIAKVEFNIKDLGPKTITRSAFLQAFSTFVTNNLYPKFLPTNKTAVTFVDDSDLNCNYDKYNKITGQIINHIMSLKNIPKDKIISEITTVFCSESYSPTKLFKFTEATNEIVKFFSNYKFNSDIETIKTYALNLHLKLYSNNVNYTFENIKTKIDELYNLLVINQMFNVSKTISMSSTLAENETFANKRTLFENKLVALKKDRDVITNL